MWKAAERDPHRGPDDRFLSPLPALTARLIGTALLGVAFQFLELGRHALAAGDEGLSLLHHAQNLGAVLRKHLRELRQLSPGAVVENRYAKFRKLGPVTGPAIRDPEVLPFHNLGSC